MNEAVNQFLSILTKRARWQRCVRNMILAGLRSPEVFDGFETAFRDDLKRFFTAQALDMMDCLSVNEYWFTLMAGAALVRAEVLPAGTAEVHEGLYMLRNRYRQGEYIGRIFEKIRIGTTDHLSDPEVNFARAEGLLVWEAVRNGPEWMRANPVFFMNTDKW